MFAYRIYFCCKRQIREAIICIAIEEVEFLNSYVNHLHRYWTLPLSSPFLISHSFQIPALNHASPFLSFLTQRDVYSSLTHSDLISE
jgi:hypothetical protein